MGIRYLDQADLFFVMMHGVGFKIHGNPGVGFNIYALLFQLFIRADHGMFNHFLLDRFRQLP